MKCSQPKNHGCFGIHCDGCQYQIISEAQQPESPLDEPAIQQKPVNEDIEDMKTLADFERRLRAAQEDLPPEFAKVLDDHFFDLLA